MDAKQILASDAAALIEAYTQNELTPGEAVEAYIAHQNRFNPALNLVVEQRYEKAREEAAEWTRKYQEGEARGKLAGVPISVKESLDVEGMHTTGGMLHNADNLAGSDAQAVAMLRAEGAIILGKTNTPTLCFCQETDNLLFGRSNNPWNPECTTGGSSGGEAALIAVGGAAAGFGSDIGGSIRIPSHFNGVVGFKPGAHRFPDQGHLPSVDLEHQRAMLGFGPIVKSVRDAALLYSIIYPGFQLPEDWTLPPDLHAVSFGSFHKTQCTPETEAILAKAQQAMAGAGVQVSAQTPYFMDEVSEVWQLVMSEDRGEGINALAYPGKKWAFLLDWMRAKAGLRAKNHPYLSWALVGTTLFGPSARQMERIKVYMETGAAKIQSLLGGNGVFLTPAYPSPAKKHGQVYGEIFSPLRTFRWVMPYTALGNVFGLPALIVPCGVSEDGLPIGLQAACLPGNEDTLFRFGHFLETALGGWQRNTMYD